MSGAMLLLMAAGGYRLTISNLSVSDPASVLAEYVLQSDGDILSVNSGGSTDVGDWISPKAASSAGLFSAKATLNSGTLAAGSSATGSWLALTSTRQWIADSGNSANLTIELSDDGGTTTRDSATITLDAT